MWIYYRDVTRYNLAISFFTAIASAGLYDSFIDWLQTTLFIFGVFGTGFGILAFNYFQKKQYYLYYNLGFTKSYLIFRSWGINLMIALLLLLILALFK